MLICHYWIYWRFSSAIRCTSLYRAFLSKNEIDWDASSAVAVAAIDRSQLSEKAFLFVPFLTLVVLQDMHWQNVNVQYYYGIICFFFFITLQFVVNRESARQRNALLALMLCSTVIFSPNIIPYWQGSSFRLLRKKTIKSMKQDGSWFQQYSETATVTALTIFIRTSPGETWFINISLKDRRLTISWLTCWRYSSYSHRKYPFLFFCPIRLWNCEIPAGLVSDPEKGYSKAKRMLRLWIIFPILIRKNDGEIQV